MPSMKSEGETYAEGVATGVWAWIKTNPLVPIGFVIGVVIGLLL